MFVCMFHLQNYLMAFDEILCWGQYLKLFSRFNFGLIKYNPALHEAQM